MASTGRSVLLLTLVVSSAYSLTLFGQKRRMEAVVRRYFDGVTKKDPEQIRSCFADEASITDVVNANTKNTVRSKLLVERCMDFVTAHRDCVVKFHYPPQCGRSSNWIYAHWYETGTWSGESCGLKPSGAPMTCEGQTRFLVKGGKITEFVVTRTMTDWELAFIAKQKQEEEDATI